MEGDVRWFLVSEGLPAARQELPLGQRLSAGRAEDAFVRLAIEDSQASRYHALFEATPAGVYVLDLKSTNGVRVNGQRVESRVLGHDDRIQLGQARFRLEMEVVPTVPSMRLAAPPPVVAPPAWAQATVKAQPYRCAVCSVTGPVPAVDHEPWWSEVEWICPSCAERRRTRPDDWEVPPPEIEEYDVLRFLDRGGMAAVFEARHRKGGMRVALKVMLPERSLDERARARFVKEQQIASSLVHPSIVRCFGVGGTRKHLYVAMEFLSGGEATNLADVRDERACVRVAADVFDALSHAHALGIIHRDVKPSNVLLFRGPDGNLRGKLSDFGIAKNLRDVGGAFLTKSSDVGGSACFVAPEQLTGFKRVGPSADLYGAGASLYYLLTAEVPIVLPCTYGEATDPQMWMATLTGERVPVGTRAPKVHPYIAQWVDFLVARDEAGRSGVTAAQVGSTLRAYLG